MMDAALRATLCEVAADLFRRGLTNGSSGNISAKLPDGSILISPTGTSFGALDPARLAHLAPDGAHVSGDLPSKEYPLHTAFYATRARAGAVIHTHSTHIVALSMLPGTDADNLLPPLTPYAIMRLGKVVLLPFLRPGDPVMGEAIRALGGRRAAVVFANHGPVVSAGTLSDAANALEELEEAAKLTLLTRGLSPRLLTPAQVADIVAHFGVEWDTG